MEKMKELTTNIGCFFGKITIFCIVSILLCEVFLYIESQLFFLSLPEKVSVKNWEEFHTYMTKSYYKGMPRQTVYKELEELGDYRITSVPWGDVAEECEIIGLPIGKPITFGELRYIACFSTRDQTLVEWKIDD